MKNQIQTASEVNNSSSTSTLAHETRKDKQGLIMFVASHGRTIEAKNGLSSKSQTSKGVMSYLVIAALAVAAVVTSCSNPESDGIKAAKAKCKCELMDNDLKYGTMKGNDGDTWSFTTKEYSECKDKAKEIYNKKREKYRTNEKTDTQFNYAFNGYQCKK